MKNILYGYNPKTLNHQELLKIKTKINSTIKRNQTWYFLWDQIDINLKIQTQSDYNNTLQVYKQDKIIFDILTYLKLRDIQVIGCGIPNDVFTKNAKLNTNGECVDCVKVVNDYEKMMIKLIEQYKSVGNIFVLLDDIHYRTTRSIAYGLPSKLLNYMRDKVKFETIRPTKKSIL